MLTSFPTVTPWTHVSTALCLLDENALFALPVCEDERLLGFVDDKALLRFQIGEDWWGLHDMAKSEAARASDCAMVYVTKIWGVTSWLGAAALAEAAGVPVSSHLFPEVSAHLLAVTPTCYWLEYLDLAGPVLSALLALVEGHAIASSRPGIGLEWNEKAAGRRCVLVRS